MRAAFGTFVYEVAYWIIAFVLTIGFSLRIVGRRNLPRDGPVLFIANHQSFLDPIAIGLGIRRHISYLARKPLFANKYFGAFLRTVNSVPIDQTGVGIDGIRAILERLQNGGAVLVFPEGERCWDGKLNEFKPGISLLIKRVQVPIVSVGIAGAYQAWPRTRPLPIPAPIFLPNGGRNLSVAFGPARDPKTLAHMSREELLKTLHEDLERAYQTAEETRDLHRT